MENPFDTSLAEHGLDWPVLARYLAGEATPAESARVRAWMGDNAERRRELEFLRTVWESPLQSDAPVRGVDAAVARLRVQMEGTDVAREGAAGADRESAPNRWHRGTQAGWGRRWFAAAGVAVLVAAAAVGIRTGTVRRHGRGLGAMSTYVTGNGQRANIMLPDGNTVALDVASRLDVPADYLVGNHTLRLAGEAVFTVRRRDGVPFTVIAGTATMHVLGTSFLVRHYATDAFTSVAVRDGKVAVRGPAKRPVVLAAAQEVKIDRTGVARVQAADLTQFSFAAGILVLKGVPFADAMADLSRWYDADIRLGDPVLASQRVTGDYATGSLAELAEILEGTFNVRVVREGRVLTLFPR